jgi:mono/diheme cytochrome c family protein
MKKTMLAIVAFFLVGGFAVYWNATQRSSQGAGHSMVPPDTSTLAEGAPIVEVALPTELSEQARIGKQAFDAKCAACHGTNAAGQNGVAPPLVHKIYEPNHHSDMAFVIAAKNGVRAHHWNFGNMPPVEGLTDGDVKLIARYIRELQKENGIF